MKASSEEEQGRASRKPRSGRTPGPVDPGTDLPAVRGPRSRRRWYFLAAGVLAVAAPVAIIRTVARKPAPSASVSAVSMDGNRIRFTEEFAARHGISAVKAVEGELSPTIQVMGTVRYDVRKFAAIGARSAGRVRRVLKIMGDEVKAGDLVADIESVDLGKAQAAAESLRAKELAAKTNLAREQQLAEAKVTAMREAEAAKAEYEALRAERYAAEKAVAAMGAKLDSEVGILPLRTPIAGRVIRAKASRGQTVEPSDTLFEVADLSTVWVELLVFERDLERVHEEDQVEITPAAGKGEVLRGKLAHLAHVVDPTTRTAVARVEVDNRRGWLRPGESTSARIHTRRLAAPAVTVPKSSVTFIDGKPTVLVLAAPGLVEPRHLELGADDGERVVVRQGLRAGESVITQGLFALKSEIFR
jgi:membrane fusion protein, heavy metal efflux system